MTAAVGAVLADRPGAGRLLLDQLGYAGRDLWRSRVVLIFTFVLPLTWLVIMGAIAGNDVLENGVRVMQFVTPTAAAMGVLYAAYPTVAISLALAREQGVLKRIRGTPLPVWTYLAGRIGGAVAFAVLSVSMMLAVGVVAYDVGILWRTALATLVTLVVGIATFAAIGLAVAALSPNAGVAQAVSVATAVALTFISEMFTIGGQMPGWLSRVGDVFPLKHFVVALQDQFNPFHSGAGWNWTSFAAMGAWLLAAVVVASRAFGWESARGRAPAPAAVAHRVVAQPAVSRPGRPSVAAGVLAQMRWANRSAWRDPGSVFFAVAMPLGLYALIVVLFSDGGDYRGVFFPLFFAVSMTAYGAAVTAFVNMPEAVARARDRGVLKRLRGTPASAAEYLAGRTASVVWIALVTGALVLLTGVLFFDVTVNLAGLPLALGVLMLGVLTIAACGYALASLVPNSQAMGAVGLAILLPLAFVSDVFLIGETPAWMSTIGSVFPLQPFVHSLAAALNPDGVSVLWGDLAVMAAWLVVATLVAVRRFRWEPRSG